MNKIITFLTLFATNLCVGQTFSDTKGTVEISNSGQATYTLPIAMPPSIKNVAPVINLTYSSGEKGGIAGQGWKINSISSICRISTRKDIDGLVDGVDFDSNDKLALDGQRLLLKSGTYWVNGSTYETEYKSNVKIELKSQGAITYFIVTSPDGSRSWYGSAENGNFQNAVSESAWYIVRHEDVYGNYISYEYNNVMYNNSNQWYIKEIKFSGNESVGLTQSNKIIFNYLASKRIERDYINGNAYYATQILNTIEVKTNDELFRRYELTRSTDDSGYERVTQIKEVNPSSESANPVVLEYYSTQTNTNRIIKPYDNNLNFENTKLAGDFDGDGRLDFIANNKIYTKLFNTEITNPISMPPNVEVDFVATTLTNNKLNQFQSLGSFEMAGNMLQIKVYDFNPSTSSLGLSYTRTIPNINNTTIIGDGSPPWAPTPCTSRIYPHEAQIMFEGDFNGDGITEIIFSQETSCSKTLVPEEVMLPNGQGSYIYCHETTNNCNVTVRSTMLVDLNPNSPSIYGSSSYFYIDNWNDIFRPSGLHITKSITLDYNGDGKTDILSIFNNDTYVIATINQHTFYPYIEAEKIGQGTLPGYQIEKQVYVGDFNGDGKSDIMIPASSGCSGCNVWGVYFSNQNTTGGESFVKENFTIDEYWPNTGDNFDSQIHFSNYYIMDVNKDGKSDFVRVWRKYAKPDSDWSNPATWTINDHDTEWSVSVFTNYIGKVGVTRGFIVSYYSGEFHSDSPDIPIPIAANYKYHGANTDLVIIRGHYNKIEYYQFDKDFNKDNRLKSVTESNGNIKHTIEYSPMQPSEEILGNSAFDFYSSTNSATYPDIEIIKNPNYYLVSKLTATVNGASKHQDFKYRSLVSNFLYGSVGFKRTARSSWYVQSSDPKIWTTQENDISLRGANTITWTSKNGSSVFSSVPDNLLSTKTNVFATYINPTTKVYNLLLMKQTTKDELTNIKIEQNFTYDGTVNSAAYFGLQTQCLTKYFNGTLLQGTHTSATDITDYDNNPTGGGNSYRIGRPKRVTTSSSIYGSGGTDTRTSEEKYTYSGPNLIKIQKKGHNTDYIVEEMNYDPLGNLLTKTVSMPSSIPAVTPRTIIDVYDPTGRFVKRKTDHQGFVTLFDYNAMGQITKSTNYLGVVNDFKYDDWGKLTESKVSGASVTPKITTTTYFKNNDGGYFVLENNTSGTYEMNLTLYDVLGRTVKTGTKAFEDDILVFKSIEYDALGRKKREWEPYFNTPSKKTDYEYDDLNRLIKVTAPTGKIQNISYSGLMTISDDDGRITTATLDALGNKVQTTDEGGTVNFNYFANGQLKSSGYEGNNVTIEIDGWGNKISTNDPNAGIYTYNYDGFGQLINETTPTGGTIYEYDAFGKLITKKISGDGADYNIAYTYNSFGQLTNEISKNSVNATIDTFDYVYDSLHRVTTTTENNNAIEHIKTITYDDFGRVTGENNSTREKLASSFTSTFLTKYSYNAYNGIMDKVTDSNGAILWQLNTANEKMQSLTTILGNGIAITNTYTPDYYLDTQVHQKNQSIVLNSAYDFEPKRGNLISRNNNVFNIYEAYTYDNLDRLTSWTNPISGSLDYNGYDNKGRISVNNKVGDVRYNTDVNSGIYRKDNIKLNPEGQLYYGILGGNLIVNYTMFKSPITINESNKGKIDFEYNSHLSRTKMMYDYGTIAPSNIKVQRKTKFYTDDGNAEVIYDNLANTIKIITYIGGDAYDAIMYIDKTIDRTTNIITEKKYYLHRDYLGSILAITDETGSAVEKRHFDAWGNLTNIINASGGIGDITNGLQFLDRGYTSHEHLKEVRLIHMNGRLYDPMLRSFMMPDNFVQQPENSQNYNRYAYCLNNPLKYTDPSGEELVTAIIIGAAIAAATYTLTAALADVPFTVNGLIGATFIGAASATVTFGIGSGAESLFCNFYSRAAFQAMAHGSFQGAMAGVQGGKFWSGFAAGALSSIASSAFAPGYNHEGIDADGNMINPTKVWSGAGSIANSSAGMIAFGTVVGGAAASLTGGNFWQGAVTGLFVSGLNHAMHSMNEGDNGYDKNGNKVDDRGGDTIDYRYGEDGSVVSSTKVEIFGSEGAVAQRGYGFKMYMAKGGIAEDNTIFGLYSGAKVAGLGLSYLRSAGSKLFGNAAFNSKLMGYASKLYGRFHAKHLPQGRPGLLNKGFIRTGWGNNNGVHTFRTSIGHSPNQKHIDWFYKP